jgi:hypothetical protein
MSLNNNKKKRIGNLEDFTKSNRISQIYWFFHPIPIKLENLLLVRVNSI